MFWEGGEDRDSGEDEKRRHKDLASWLVVSVEEVEELIVGREKTEKLLYPMLLEYKEEGMMMMMMMMKKKKMKEERK